MSLLRRLSVNRFLTFAIAAVLIALAGTAGAATRTVMLAVQNMTCPVCPITVKKALNGVAGVSHTEVSYERKDATVTFDDTKTNVDALIKATTNAGYPSTAK
jgi:periplasmic mercuric ion binding protein